MSETNGTADASEVVQDQTPATDADGDPDRPTKEESTLGRWVGKTLATVPKPLLGFRGTLFKRMASKSLHNYYKTISGADAIAINAKPGQRLDLEPVAYRAPDECGDDEIPGWYAKDRDKTWHPASEGNQVNFLDGKTPTVILEDDDHVEAGFLAPRIGKAIELDNYWPLFVDADINAVLDATPGANGARADGGMGIDLELDSPGQWAGDQLIDLSSGPEYEGMRISAERAKEWRPEKSDSEAMQRAQDRGEMLGMMNGDDFDTFKFVALWIGSLLAALALILLGPKLLSTGGGGGINPLMIGAPGLL